MIEFLIVFDVEKDWKPVGLWYLYFNRVLVEYISGYEGEMIDFREKFDSLEVKDWNEFCSYWQEQGGFKYYYAGPIRMSYETTPIAFVSKYIINLDQLVNTINRRRIQVGAVEQM